jgi:hypothetical protein
MGLFVDNIIAKFPTKTIPTTQGGPNYTSISNMVQTLCGNAASLPTMLGGGQHGHVGLFMTPILYATLSNTGATPNPIGNTIAAREIQCLDYKEARHIYGNHQNMDDALKSQVIDAINDTYLCKLQNKYTGT